MVSRRHLSPPAVPFHLVKTTVDAIRKALPQRLKHSIDGIVHLLGFSWGYCIDVEHQQDLYKRIFNVSVRINYRQKDSPLFDGSHEAWQKLLVQLPTKNEILQVVDDSDRSIPRGTVDHVLENIVQLDAHHGSVTSWRTRFKNSKIYKEWDSIRASSQLGILNYMQEWIEAEVSRDKELPSDTLRPSLSILKPMIVWKKRKASLSPVPKASNARETKRKRPLASTGSSRARNSISSQADPFPTSVPDDRLTLPSFYSNETTLEHSGSQPEFFQPPYVPNPYEAITRGENYQPTTVFAPSTGHPGHQDLIGQSSAPLSSSYHHHGYAPSYSVLPTQGVEDQSRAQGWHNLDPNNFGRR